MEYTWTKDRASSQRTYRNLDEITHDVVGRDLAAFIGKYRAAMASRHQTASLAGKTNQKSVRTKVALIDSGIVLVGPKDKSKASGDSPFLKNKTNDDLAQRVVGGTSFVNRDDEEPVWWHASEAHGTQMARLICSIDPCCDLYIVKVAETRGAGIPANTVADAIEWAISKDVDVISLSLVTFSNTPNLTKAIRAAADKDIVIISSTADEGMSPPRGGTDAKNHKNDVFTIAACTQWGRLLEYSQNDDDNYRFVGHNVYVGQVPYLKSQDTISGSSVATAIAAGTASLALACYRISGNFEAQEEFQRRRRLVRSIFDKMLVDGQRYAKLENFCGKDKNLAEASFMATAREHFRV